MRLHLGMQIALEGIAFSFAHHVHLFEFRQRLYSQPALEVKFILQRFGVIKRNDVIPVPEPALGLIFYEILPRPKRDAGVVPRVVHDQPHAAPMHFADEFQEQPVGGRPAPSRRVDRVFRIDDRRVPGRVRAERAVDVPVMTGIVLVK